MWLIIDTLVGFFCVAWLSNSICEYVFGLRLHQVLKRTYRKWCEVSQEMKQHSIYQTFENLRRPIDWLTMIVGYYYVLISLVMMCLFAWLIGYASSVAIVATLVMLILLFLVVAWWSAAEANKSYKRLFLMSCTTDVPTP